MSKNPRWDLEFALEREAAKSDLPACDHEPMVRFQVGKTYWCRSIGDSDCIHSFTILGRTAKTVTVKVYDKIVKRGLSIYEDVEQFKPFGNYSMCAVIRASKEEGVKSHGYFKG